MQDCQQNEIFIERIAHLKQLVFKDLKKEWDGKHHAVNRKHEKLVAIKHELEGSNNNFKAVRDSLNHMTAHNGQLQRKIKRAENKKQASISH